ncbi:MAG TPA: copper-binding protein [Gammaproteobacteria bacterium]|nr:copper-binding protein [Gammaproteobacteria bacterium]
MSHVSRTTAVASIALLVLVGCGESAPTGEGAAQSGSMPGMPTRSQEGVEHVAEGTVNSIDAAAGMVNISHGPVESAGWPAMTMSFKLADPDAAAGLAAGQRVDFAFTTEGGGTVTRIAPAE